MIFIYPIFLSGRSGLELYTNWNIVLPKCKNSKEVFRYEYRKGQDFIIYDFKKQEKVIDSLNMKKITINNQERIKSIINDYYDDLAEDEKNKFDNEVELDYLYNTDNYYLYLEDDRNNYVILILCPNNKLYELHNVE